VMSLNRLTKYHYISIMKTVIIKTVLNTLTFILYFILFIISLSKAQIAKDLETQDHAANALQKIYQMNFQGANIDIAKIEKKYPKHPVVPFLKCYSLSWQSFPMTMTTPTYTQYNQHLQDIITKSQTMLNKNAEDMEASFFIMTAYSLLAMHESEDGSFTQSVNYGRKAFKYMKKGFDLTDKFPDFHFTTGVYKYFAVQYPETHPIAKPFMSFFPEGSKIQGISHLNQGIQRARFSKAECYIFLHAIYAKYELNHYQAWLSAQQLCNLYPQNPFFWMKNAESLLFLGRYAEAETYLAKFSTRPEKLYKIAYHLFQGLIQEKYYKDDTKALSFYQKVITYTNYDDRYGKDYHSFAYAGLARLADKKADKNKAKEYYKTVLKLCEYKGIITEAQNYLKN
jgi:tetratricopeptide (TPR) repeat protein